MKTVVCVVFLASVASAIAVSQPVYANQQYVSAQQLQPIQLRQQAQIQYVQPQYLSAGPTQAYQAGPLQAYQAGPPRAARPPPPPPQHPPVGITQLLLPSAADRQIQKAAATLAGPEYAQQVQAVQLQGLANQAQAAATRRAQLAAQRIAQANRQAPQPQYLQQLSQPQASLPEQQLDGLAQGAQQPEDYDHNPSYQFGFDVKDDYYTNYQNRKEQRDGDKISGSYSVVDSDGFIRTVTYTADPKEGFKAQVNRQPTDIVVKIPKPVLPPLRQPQQQQEQQYIQEAPLDRSQLQGQRQKYVYQYQ